LLVVITLVSVIVVAIIPFFTRSFRSYLSLQANALHKSELLTAHDRVGRILRGSTEITDAQTDEITTFVYFTPQDNLESKVRIYTDADGRLLADLIRPSGTPPNITYDPDDTEQVTLANNISNASSIITYYDEDGDEVADPNTDLAAVRQLRFELEAPKPYPPNGSESTLTVNRVTLRNYKRNL
jgi:flagellar hook assembly protein FlgD